MLTPAFINPDQAEALPLAVLLLLAMVAALLVVVLRQRRALRRLAPSTLPSTQPGPEIAGVDVRGSTSRDAIAHASLVISIAAARDAMAQLAASPDFVGFERIIGLGEALADLQGAAGSGASEPLATALRDGLGQAGWLQRIFRAELLLEALAAPGSAWSGLGRALAAIGVVTRAELASAGVEVIRPLMLGPVQRGHEVADESLSDLRHVVVLNRAVRSAVGGVSEPAILVVDCLRCGTREIEAGNPIPRVTPVLVVLYAPMLWRAAASS